MAALHQSAALLHPKSSTISFSLRSFTRLPSRPLTVSFPRRRRHGGATMADTASSSYATALADLANSNNTLDATLADMEKVAKIFSDSAVATYFINPTVVPEKKKELVEEMARSSKLQPHTANFLNIVIEMRRTELLKEIAKEFEIRYNKITGTEVAVVTSVVQLGSQHLAQIAKTVQKFTGAKNVRIKTEIDPSLIAGFTIRYGSSGSKLIDMSIKKQLDEITTQLDFSDISLV